MAPGGEMYRLHEHFGENVLCHGSHEWLPYSKNVVRTKSSNTNLSFPFSHRALALHSLYSSSAASLALATGVAPLGKQ